VSEKATERIGGTSGIPTYQLLWAKTSKDRTATHPLICHMIDVAQVALAMWHGVLTESMRAHFSTALGLEEGAAGRLIAFWAGLHDLGKASPAFQRQYGPGEQALRSAGLHFERLFVKEKSPHGTISAYVLRDLLQAESALAPRLARRIAHAVGGHHGTWPSSNDVQALKSVQVGDNGWESVRRDLVRTLAGLYTPPPAEGMGRTRAAENAILTLLSGLTSTADWIGSMEEYFPFACTPLDLADYVQRSAAQAYRALQRLGWTDWQPPAQAASFEGLFRFAPRPMQQAVIDMASRLGQPGLVIIEAPTGAGKTEAALHLADHWAHTCHQRGLYVAMPTMATSNQMFERVQAVLARRYTEELINVHLLHGQARWRDDVRELRLEIVPEDPRGTVAAMAWFLPRKRGLLATFGVGTVDQALLSVLQTRHFFVRLFGLSHKTVIFDEVHAYDTYMSTLFQQLLGWLRAVGASVVILSATLPARTRRELLQAYSTGQELPLPEIPYPAITWVTGDQAGVVPLPAPESRTIALDWIAPEPESIVKELADRLRDGGCAAVVCNRVRRAQEVYRTIKRAGLVSPDDLVLFHARFPLGWRDGIEKGVLDRFGKDGKRPQRAIVVATQVIEQSLDLDFDLMVSDLAPVDLVLQRAGRLHRHARENRPGPLRTPRVLLAAPEVREGIPDFGADVYVYEPYTLLRSYLALRGQTQISLPAETAALIESVYGEEELQGLPAAMATALQRALQQRQQHHDKYVVEAWRKLIPSVQAENLLWECNLGLEEDKPELHAALQALTRLTPPSISLVCLHRTAAGLTLNPDGSGPVVNLEQEPGASLTREMALATATVSHPAAVRHFRNEPVPSGWKDHPLLHDHRPAIFTDGVCRLSESGRILRLDRELGLEISREEAKEV
jgi:CRISPR-associated endonuclease/helicase Cas3